MKHIWKAKSQKRLAARHSTKLISRRENLIDTVGEARTPDFFCIGAEKAGTTWLWNWMNHHTEIGVPASKELRFFDQSDRWDTAHFRALSGALSNAGYLEGKPAIQRQLVEQLRLYFGGTAAYLRIFGMMPEKVVGEISPQYCALSSNSVQQMSAIAPNAKILYMLRDPTDRLISGAKMTIRQDQVELDDANILRYATDPTQRSYSKAAKHIEKFEQAFGTNNVLVLFYDDIISCPNDVVSKVCKFLNVTTKKIDQKLLSQRVNEGERFKPAPSTYNSIRKTLIPTYDRLEARYPNLIARWKEVHSQ